MKKYLILIFLLIFCLPIIGFGQKTEEDFHAMLKDMYEYSVPLVKADALPKSLDGYVILDTREKKEYDISHIDGAKQAGFLFFKEKLVEDLPKDQPILVYCSVGYRSERIGEKLKKMGFTKVWNLYGGIFDWKNSGLPVVNEKKDTTNQVHTYNQKWSQWLFNGEKVY